MATYKSKAVENYRPAVDSCQAGEIKTVRGEIDLAADVGGALADGDILEMVKLPPQHVPVDCVVDSDDLDSNGTPTITFKAGVIGGDDDALIADGNTTMQSSGIARMDAQAGPRVASSDSETKYGITVTADPATGATTGKVGFALQYRARLNGE